MPVRESGSPAEAASGSVRDRLRREAVRGVWWWRSHRYVDRAGAEEDTTLLLGSARSGTTWVGELIDRHRDHRVLFEPFSPARVPEMSAFEGVDYLAPGSGTREQRDQAARMLRGEVRNGWVDHTNRAVLPRRRLLKEVRANCLAGWLSRTFPDSPLVLVIRHPLAVAASRLRLGWEDNLDPLLRGDLRERHLGEGLARTLEGWQDPLSRQVAQWAIETAVPLRELGPDTALAVHYEQLRWDPENQAARLLAHVGQTMDEQLTKVLERPSRTTSGAGSAVRPLPGIDRAQEQAVEWVLEQLDLGGMYRPGSREPDPSVTERLQASGH